MCTPKLRTFMYFSVNFHNSIANISPINNFLKEKKTLISSDFHKTVKRVSHFSKT